MLLEKIVHAVQCSSFNKFAGWYSHVHYLDAFYIVLMSYQCTCNYHTNHD